MIIDDFKLWLKSNEERILQQGLRLVDVYKNITEKEIEKSGSKKRRSNIY